MIREIETVITRNITAYCALGMAAAILAAVTVIVLVRREPSVEKALISPGDAVTVVVAPRIGTSPVCIGAVCERRLATGGMVVTGAGRATVSQRTKQIWFRGTLPPAAVQQSTTRVFSIDSLLDVTVSSEGPIKESASSSMANWLFDWRE